MKPSEIAEDLLLLDAEGYWEPSEANLGEEMQALASRCRELALSPYHALLMLLKLRAACEPAAGEGVQVAALSTAILAAYELDWDEPRLSLELLQLNLFNMTEYSVCSREMAFYVSEREKSADLLAAAEREQVTIYTTLHRRFLRLNDQLGVALVKREDAMLRRAAVEQEFMRLLGEAWLTQSRAALHLRDAEIRLELLREDPRLSQEDLDDLVAERLAPDVAAFQASLESMRLAVVEVADVTPGDPADVETLKKLLKENFHVLHPDRHVDLPLTDRQREQLAALWDCTQSIDRQRLPDSGTVVTRSVELLRACLERARAILRIAGVDIDAALVVQGDTLEERIAYLKLHLPRLEMQLHRVFEELRGWREDIEHRWRQTLIEYPAGEREREAEQMRDRARVLELHAQRLEQRIEELIRKGHEDE